MPRLNRRGQALMGQGGGPASVDGQVLAIPGGSACWLDDDRVLVNSNARVGSWEVLEIDTHSKGQFNLWSGGANFLAAGGGRWLGWAAGTGMFGSLGLLPAAGVRGAGRNGTLAYCPSYQTGVGMYLMPADGTAPVWIPDAVVRDADSLQIIGSQRALWFDGQHAQSAGIPPIRPALPVWNPRRVEVGGEVWLVYWSNGTGMIAQLDGATDGYILETRPICFHMDAGCPDGTQDLLVVWSVTQGEGPGDLVRRVVDRTQPRVALAPPQPAPVTIGRFDHPVLIAPFKDPLGESDAPAEVVVNQTGQRTARPCIVAEDSLAQPRSGPLLGIYSEAGFDVDVRYALALAAQFHTRLFLAHDSIRAWTLPPGLRAWDVPLLELYLAQGESLAVTLARHHQQAQALLAQWPHDCGLIPMFYCQGGAPPHEVWPVGDVLALLARLSEIVNLSPRFKVVLPFAWRRDNGIDRHGELRATFQSLLEASPGLPNLTPVGVPLSPPLPPAPKPSRFRHYTHYVLGGPMQTERGGLVGVKGKFARGDQHAQGIFPGTFALVVDADASDGDAEFELSARGDGMFNAKHVASGLFLEMDATQFSTALDKQYYLKASDGSGYAALQGGQMPDGTVLLFVKYTDPRAFVAAPLVWVKK